MTALFITGWACALTFGGGLIALRLEAYRAFVIAFAAGALVGSALMDVIPDALDLLTRSQSPLYHHHHVLLATTLGFLFFYLLEQVSHWNGHGDHGEHKHGHGRDRAGLLGAAGIGVHSLLDGIAVGEAFRAGNGIGWTVALAVVLHKFADGVSTVGIMVSTGRSRPQVNAMLALTTVAPLAGLALQAYVPLPLDSLALVLGWFAGVFLYLGAAALIPAAHAASRSGYVPVATLLGVVMVYVLTRAAQ